MQDVPQNEALRTPVHVVLSELFEGKVTLKESCARQMCTIRHGILHHLWNFCVADEAFGSAALRV